MPFHDHSFTGREWWRTADADYWPATEALDWHANNIFRHR
jgi:hypothetical protein